MIVLVLNLSCDWFEDCLSCAGCHLLFAAQLHEVLNENFLDPQNYKKRRAVVSQELRPCFSTGCGHTWVTPSFPKGEKNCYMTSLQRQTHDYNKNRTTHNFKSGKPT